MKSEMRGSSLFILHAKRRLKCWTSKRISLRRSRKGCSEMGKHTQPVILGAKTPFGDHLRQVLICGRDNADVHSHRAGAADLLEFLLLEQAQQFRLLSGATT